jgi:hypothetical protein
LRETGVHPDQRIFPIRYEAVRAMVKKAGDVVGVATHASRSGVPVEIVSSEHALGNDLIAEYFNSAGW